jgi:hypothetical protein
VPSCALLLLPASEDFKLPEVPLALVLGVDGCLLDDVPVFDD